jgi:hypothetical protein
VWRWRRRPVPDPSRFGDLTIWETTDEDGDELVLWAEMSTDSEARDAVAELKEVMRNQGWTQTVGD